MPPWRSCCCALQCAWPRRAGGNPVLARGHAFLLRRQRKLLAWANDWPGASRTSFSLPTSAVFRARLSADPVGPVSPAGHRRASLLGPSLESALLGAAAVALVIGWAGWLFDARTGRVAGLLAALYPGQIGLGALVLSEAAVCPLIDRAALAVGSCQPQRRPSGGLALVGGCRHRGRSGHIGAAQLAALYAVCRAHGDRILTPQAGTVCRRLAMLALLAAVLAPWWIRKSRIIGHFVPTTLQVGASLYDGLNPMATGASDMRFAPSSKPGCWPPTRRMCARAKIRWSIGSIGCWPPRPSAGPSASAARAGAGRHQAGATVERLAERKRVPRLAAAAGSAGDLRASAPGRPLRRLEIHSHGLAVCPGLAAGRLFDAIAHDLRQLAALPRAGDVGADRAGRRGHYRGRRGSQA